MTRPPARCDGPSRSGAPALWRASVALTVAAALLTLAGCIDGSPSDPGVLPPVDVVVLSGDGQFALPGETLEPFEILVRDPESQEPEGDVRVEWELTQGPGGALDRTAGFTDGAGRASTTLTLGGQPAAFTVRARFPDNDASEVEFEARAVVRPELNGVPTRAVTPGSPVVLEGAHFVPELDRIDVLFSGMRAPVLSGDETSLRVRVPGCLNEPRVPVVVGLGPVRSDPLSVDVEGRGAAVGLAPGEVHRTVDPEALSCIRLEGGPDREYLAVVHSASTVGSARHRYGLALRAPVAAAAPPETGGLQGRDAGGVHLRWETLLRRLEARALSEGDRGVQGARAPTPAAGVPSVGDQRRFQVLNRDRSFTEVQAEVRHVSDHAVVYVDREAPQDGFEDDDLRSLAREFDDPIHSTVTDAFGNESDLDDNGRVVILFTPVVNRLTEPGSDGFVGGFFFGVDLLPDQAGSNGAEIFYALVPDEDGEFGDRRSRVEVLARVPGILAHEFQHMVHFNQRVLIRGAERTDALWLSEALATTAEDLVGDVLARRGNHARADLYHSSNRVRARRFLAETEETSLVVTQGSGSLEERGAGWLFLAYLRGRWGDGILSELTRSTRTGTRNVEAAVGEGWADLLEPWTAALYLDGLGVEVAEPYRFESMNLRRTLGSSGSGYPLRPPVRGGVDATIVSEVRSSAAAFSILAPESEAGLAVNLAGPEGGALPAASVLGLTVVRLR